MIVCKRVSFDAAHFLPNYPGKCENLHGHTWTVELGVSGEVDPKTGMVVDFKWLSEALENILDSFDHHLLNNIIDNPTAENIALYIQDKFVDEWIQGPSEPVQFEFIRVWETPDSFAELRA